MKTPASNSYRCVVINISSILDKEYVFVQTKIYSNWRFCEQAQLLDALYWKVCFANGIQAAVQDMEVHLRSS